MLVITRGYLFWLEGLHLSHLSCSIHTHVIQEFFDDLNSVSVFDPVVVDGSLTDRGHIPMRHAQEYKKLGLPKSLSPFQNQRSTMKNNGSLSYSLGCLAGGNACLPQRPEMSRSSSRIHQHRHLIRKTVHPNWGNAVFRRSANSHIWIYLVIFDQGPTSFSPALSIDIGENPRRKKKPGTQCFFRANLGKPMGFRTILSNIPGAFRNALKVNTKSPSARSWRSWVRCSGSCKRRWPKWPPGGQRWTSLCREWVPVMNSLRFIAIVYTPW